MATLLFKLGGATNMFRGNVFALICVRYNNVGICVQKPYSLVKDD